LLTIVDWLPRHGGNVEHPSIIQWLVGSTEASIHEDAAWRVFEHGGLGAGNGLLRARDGRIDHSCEVVGSRDLHDNKLVSGLSGRGLRVGNDTSKHEDLVTARDNCSAFDRGRDIALENGLHPGGSLTIPEVANGKFLQEVSATIASKDIEVAVHSHSGVDSSSSDRESHLRSWRVLVITMATLSRGNIHGLVTLNWVPDVGLALRGVAPRPPISSLAEVVNVVHLVAAVHVDASKDNNLITTAEGRGGMVGPGRGSIA
jgi:hypothetical protein